METDRTRRTASGCLEWIGARTSAGYGEKVVSGRIKLTHRLAWELAHGEIPAGMWVLHRCDNPPCCEPSHLFLGTHQDNVTDKMQKGRHRHGHRYGDDHHLRRNPELIKRGEAHPKSKLKLKQVHEIRRLQQAGQSDAVIARNYEISRPTVSAIRHGRLWKGL